MSAVKKILRAGLRASYWHGYTKATVKAKKTQWVKGMRPKKLRPVAGIAVGSAAGGFGGGAGGALIARGGRRD